MTPREISEAKALVEKCKAKGKLTAEDQRILKTLNPTLADAIKVARKEMRRIEIQYEPRT